MWIHEYHNLPPNPRLCILLNLKTSHGKWVKVIGYREYNKKSVSRLVDDLDLDLRYSNLQLKLKKQDRVR